MASTPRAGWRRRSGCPTIARIQRPRRRIEMTTLSEGLYELADQAKAAEQKVRQAQEKASKDAHQAATELEGEVNDSRDEAEAQAAKLRATAQASQDKISSYWDKQQQAWNDQI